MQRTNHSNQADSNESAAMLAQGRQGHMNAGANYNADPLDLPVLHEVPAVDDLPVLNFSVRYALFEYVSFMWEHSGHLIRRRRIGLLSGWYMHLKSTWSAAFHFVALGRARHTYEFTVDVHGIVRSAQSGVTLIDWNDVTAIRTYSRGFLMVLKRGTLPIPFRCLSKGQAEALAGYAIAARAGALVR